MLVTVSNQMVDLWLNVSIPYYLSMVEAFEDKTDDPSCLITYQTYVEKLAFCYRVKGCLRYSVNVILDEKEIDILRTGGDYD